MALRSTQLLTEISTGNIPASKGRPANKTDNPTAVYEPTVQRKCGNLDVLQPYGPPRSVTRIAIAY
jgi:hypothetical protein